MLKRFFKFTENSTDLKTETVAGLTTFLTMVYIVFVQVQLLSAAGMDKGAIMIATCITSAVASIVMGVVANYPIGLAPGMGENFFFVYTLVLAMGVSWEKALGMVFISGVAFMLLSVFKVRELVIDAIPDSLKSGIAVGIGVFIAFIGLHEAGIVVKNPGALVKLGSLSEPAVILSMAGLALMIFFLAKKVKGSILIGILVTALFGIMAGIIKFKGVVSAPPSISPTLFKLDILGVLKWEYIVPIVTLLYMVMFDTVGTLIGVSSQAGLMKNGRLERSSKALFSDAVGTTVGALCGSSTVVSFIESVAGVKAGGRTGFTAVVVGICFILTLFFFPFIEMVGSAVRLGDGTLVHPITAPALIVVGAMMMGSIKNILWDDFAEALPAFLTIVMIPFTCSIADGIAFGFISYPIAMLAAGRGKSVSWLVYLLAVLFILRYILL